MHPNILKRKVKLLTTTKQISSKLHKRVPWNSTGGWLFIDWSSTIHNLNTWTGRLHCMEDTWETCPTCATMTSFTSMTSQWNNWGWRAIKPTSPGGKALALVGIELLTVSSISLQSAGSLPSRQTNSQKMSTCPQTWSETMSMIIWLYLMKVGKVPHSWFLLVAYRIHMSAMYWQTVLYWDTFCATGMHCSS